MSYLPYLAVAALVVAIGAALVAVRALGRAQKALRLAQALSPDTQKLLATWQALAPEQAAGELARYLEQVGRKLQGHEAHLKVLEERSRRTFTRKAMVRFDTTEEVKGQLSFCLALLDEQGDGYLLSSMYTLQSARIFLREVRGGKTDREMIPEEAEALERALQAGPRTGATG